MAAKSSFWKIAAIVSLLASLVTLLSFATGVSSILEIEQMCSEHKTKRIAIECAFLPPLKLWAPESSFFKEEFFKAKLLGLWLVIFCFSVWMGFAQGEDGPSDWGSLMRGTTHKRACRSLLRFDSKVCTSNGWRRGKVNAVELGRPTPLHLPVLDGRAGLVGADGLSGNASRFLAFWCCSRIYQEDHGGRITKEHT